MQWAFLGNPDNRRCHYFVEAVRQHGLPPPLVYAYEEVLAGRLELQAALQGVHYLRLDAPGENAVVAQQLLEWGTDHPALGQAPRCTAAQARTWQPAHGQLAYQRQTHLGYERLLDALERSLQELPELRLANSLDFIRCCFDKAACQRHLAKAGIAVPPSLPAVQGYDDLRAQLSARGWSAAFLKPWHGSSAAGVLAYRCQGQREQVTTSVEVVATPDGGVTLYNSLRLRTYRDRKTIALLVDLLAQEGLLVERWLPKASLPGGAFDLRVVVIGGQARHVVVRQSRSPLTNLHLGNQRGALPVVQERLGDARWQELMALAEAASAALPAHSYVGLDVLISSDWKHFAILEANAFGDLLPRVLHRGQTTYEAAVDHISKPFVAYE